MGEQARRPFSRERECELLMRFGGVQFTSVHFRSRALTYNREHLAAGVEEVLRPDAPAAVIHLLHVLNQRSEHARLC